MKECRYEGLIDGYILNRLAEGERTAFEEHYFNCPSCFAKLAERDEIVGVLKQNRSLFPADQHPAAETPPASWRLRTPAFLVPRRWAFAGGMALLLAAVLIVAIVLHNASPEFILNGEDTVRGNSLTLLSPVIDVRAFPSYFEWKKLDGDEIEYRVYIYNHELLWKTSTNDNVVSLPEDIKAKMIKGQKYSWQVKAFSKEGTLIAVSSKVQFTINR